MAAKKPESGTKRNGLASSGKSADRARTKPVSKATEAKGRTAKRSHMDTPQPEPKRAPGAAAKPEKAVTEGAASSAPPPDRKANGKIKEQLIQLGKSKGFLTYDDVHEALPAEEVGPDQMEDMLAALDDERIEVVDDVNELKNKNRSPN